jgi:hypothetical protein
MKSAANLDAEIFARAAELGLRRMDLARRLLAQAARYRELAAESFDQAEEAARRLVAENDGSSLDEFDRLTAKICARLEERDEGWMR